MNDPTKLDSTALVRVSRGGSPVGTGILTEVSGYRVHISILNRNDRRLPADSGLPHGSGVELVFCVAHLPPTPCIGGHVECSECKGRTTELDVEVFDWGKLAQYWRQASEAARQRR